jgi:hypothetical protein
MLAIARDYSRRERMGHTVRLVACPSFAVGRSGCWEAGHVLRPAWNGGDADAGESTSPAYKEEWADLVRLWAGHVLCPAQKTKQEGNEHA